MYSKFSGVFEVLGSTQTSSIYGVNTRVFHSSIQKVHTLLDPLEDLYTPIRS